MTYCASCIGPKWNNCTSCTDPKREVLNGGECRCNTTANYYKHPDMDYCVNPCPSKPVIGQYYGNPKNQ